MSVIKMIVSHEDLKPVVGVEGSAGYDLKIASDVIIRPGAVTKVGTGVKVEIPVGYVGIVTPRSSCTGIELENVTGMIDHGYQGEIFLKLLNTTNTTFLGYRGDRLMQLVVVKILEAKVLYVDKFETQSIRGNKGFGSTGAK